MVRTGFRHGARTLLGVAAVLFSVLGLTGVQAQPQLKPQPSEQFGPTLAVDPGSGHEGDVIIVSGRGWVANTPVTLSTTPVGSDSAVLVGQATPTSTTFLAAGPASFDTAVTIPASPPGDITISACQACDRRSTRFPAASVAFVVLPPSPPTDTAAGGQSAATPSSAFTPSTAPGSATPTSAATPSLPPTTNDRSGLVLPLLGVAGVLMVLIGVATVGLLRTRSGVRAGHPVTRLSATSRPDPTFPVRAHPATRPRFPNLRLVPHPSLWTVTARKEPDR